MKKRLFALILILLVSLSLIACGKKEGSTNSENNISPTETLELPANTMPDAENSVNNTEQENVTVAVNSTPDKITFSPYVLLAEDEKVKIELMGFHQEYLNSLDCLFDIQITNKTDGEIFVIFEGYLGNQYVNSTCSTGNVGPAPGKSRQYPYRIYHEDNSPVDSMDELYQMNGNFRIGWMGEQYFETTTVPFEVPTIVDVGDSVDQSASNKVSSLEPQEIPLETPVIVLDNEYVKIIAVSKISSYHYNSGRIEDFATGYSLYIENKIPDHTVEVMFQKLSIDGFMQKHDHFVFSQKIDGGKKTNYELKIKNDYLTNDPPISTIEDCKNMDGTIWIRIFDENGSSYIDAGHYPFENVLP